MTPVGTWHSIDDEGVEAWDARPSVGLAGQDAHLARVALALENLINS